MDHPYETDVVVFPNGEIVFGGRIASNPNNTASLEFGLDVRSQDVSFILDTFNISKTIYVGHSYGGASAAASLANETRILGGVNLDGALWGPVQEVGVPRPFLTFGSEGHNSSDEASWARLFDATRANYPDTWITELSIQDSVHGSFCDFPLIGNATGLSENPDLVDILFGKIQVGRLLNIVVEYLDDFIHFALGCGGEGLLTGENPDYPEVLFVQKSS
jgi:pimeloyl-ACP methyl ester carboxylesterase